MNPAVMRCHYRVGWGSLGGELVEFEERGNMCEVRWGNTELQSDAHRKFCAMLWEICPSKVIQPGDT